MTDKKNPKPELLAPAGSLEKLKTAIFYGADAVYLAGKHYSLRAHATLSEHDLQAAVHYAHNRGVKVYVTVNIFGHNQDFTGLEEYLRFLADTKVDGLIIADPGILRAAKRAAPSVPMHLSTQANVTNLHSALFWQEQGVSRLNLARELSLSEISTIRKNIQAEIEVFVHGALCISYSGRCNLSLYLTGRDANLGDCAHPCRYRYILMEEKRHDQYFPVEEDERGTYIFNAKDLCLLARLPDLVRAGVDSVKIEGRMKSLYYVGAVVRVYRAALDLLYRNGWSSRADGSLLPQFPHAFQAELQKIGSRGYTENFIQGTPGSHDMLYGSPRIEQTHVPVGIVLENGREPLIDIRNPVTTGEKIEYLGTGLENTRHEIIEMVDQEGNPLEKANPGNRVLLKTTPPPSTWKQHALLRKKL